MSSIKCYFFVKNGEIVNYNNNLNIKLNDDGKEKIEQIVNFIKNLKVDYLESQKDLAMRILAETKSNFPYKELLPIILEILINQNLKDHQAYFCLKILKNLLYFKNFNHLNIDKKKCLKFIFEKYKKRFKNLINSFK